MGLEAVSLGFYYSQENQLFYTIKNTTSKVREDLEKTGTRLDISLDSESILERIHPFFGYVVKGGNFSQQQWGIRVNNYGFVSQYNYPLLKTNKNQFIIGVFGGSVANSFAVNIHVNKSRGNEEFIKNLKTIPELVNKEIIILSFASGGYKQPQQLLILNYFLSLGQEFDMVINIDGFNEVALSHQNNQAQIELSLPSIQHILPLTKLASDDLSVMKTIVQISEQKQNLVTAINKLESCKLALCHSVRSLQVKGLMEGYQKEIINYDEKIARNSSNMNQSDSLIYLSRMPAMLKDEVAFEKIAENWYESSLIMSQILANKNILYFHFIQPNQYYPTARVFVPEEKDFIIEGHPYSIGVRKGYPALLSRVNSLWEANVNIFNGVNIFDEEKEIVYRDACCHYNPTGDRILEKYVVNAIKSVMENRDKNQNNTISFKIEN